MKTHQILACGPWNTPDIEITISQKMAVDTKSKNIISRLWEKHILTHPLDFNSQLLSLCNWTNRSGRLHLELGFTDYATYIATKEIDSSDKKSKVEKAQPLGMCLIIRTSDKRYIFTKRSESASQSAGKGYLIGGYIEPIETEGVIFGNAEREIREEINVDEKHISSLNVLWLAYNNNHPHPELFVSVDLSIASSDINNLWLSAKDKNESKNIYFLSPEEISHDFMHDFFRGRMSASLELVLEHFDFTNSSIRPVYL